MASLRELAKICGVSLATVDRALHNRGRIDPKVQKRILAKSRELGYLPNPSVNEIIRQKSNIAGFVIPAYNNEWCMELLLQVKLQLKATGLKMFIMMISDEQECIETLRELISRKAAAIVFIPQNKYIPLPAAELSNTRILTLAHHFIKEKHPILNLANTKEIKEDLDFLFKKGHRRILFYTIDTYISEHRKIIKHYQKFMKIKKLKSVVYTEPAQALKNQDMIEMELLTLIQQEHITAVYTFNYRMALRLQNICWRNNIKIPDKLSLCSHGATRVLVDLCPGIRTRLFPHQVVAENIVHWILTGKIKSLFQSSEILEGKSVSKCTEN